MFSHVSIDSFAQLRDQLVRYLELRHQDLEAFINQSSLPEKTIETLKNYKEDELKEKLPSFLKQFELDSLGFMKHQSGEAVLHIANARMRHLSDEPLEEHEIFQLQNAINKLQSVSYAETMASDISFYKVSTPYLMQAAMLYNNAHKHESDSDEELEEKASNSAMSKKSP